MVITLNIKKNNTANTFVAKDGSYLEIAITDIKPIEDIVVNINKTTNSL